MSTYYHTTAEEWDGGDLQCWNTREAYGLISAADWKWDDAPVGADGHLVALTTSLEEAQDIRCDIDGCSILCITLPDGSVTESAELDWDDEDEDRVYLDSIIEGISTYPAALGRIPAKYITKVE